MLIRLGKPRPRRRASVMAVSLIGAFFLSGCGSTGPDVTPPGVPQGFAYDRNRSGDGEISFVWQRNRETDLAGYYLYRATDAAHLEFTRIATISRDSTTYTDSNLDYTMTFHYRLTAFDRSDNESPPTDPVVAIAANLTAPATPTNVNAVAQNLQPPASITLSWSPNTEADLKEYQIFRGALPGVSASGAPFATVEKGRTTYEDTAIFVGTRFFYRVLAVDMGGLKSPVSQSVEVSDAALAPPSLLSPGPNATALSATPTFRWMTVAQAVGYKLFVTKDALGVELQWQQYVSAPTTEITYSGPALASGGAYYWRLATTTKGESPINSISELRKFITP